MKSHGTHHKTDYNIFYIHCSRHNSVTVSFLFTSPTDTQSLKLKDVVTILLKVKNCTIRINLLYG